MRLGAIVLTSVGAGIVAAGAYQDDWDGFGDRLLAGAAWTTPSLVGGIISLVGGKSPAERMWDSYRARRDAY